MRLALCVFALACAGPACAMTLTSHDLTPGGVISAAHIYPRCGGQNISPELSWAGQPAAARTLALTMIDLDVKPSLWSHWIVVDIPASTTSLPRGVARLPAGAHAVASNFGDAAYDGPCPPHGSGVHRYQFTIWALPAAAPKLKPDEKAAAVMARLSAVALDHASLTATVAAK